MFHKKFEIMHTSTKIERHIRMGDLIKKNNIPKPTTQGAR